MGAAGGDAKGCRCAVKRVNPSENLKLPPGLSLRKLFSSCNLVGVEFIVYVSGVTTVSPSALRALTLAGRGQSCGPSPGRRDIRRPRLGGRLVFPEVRPASNGL